ncbi:MAG: tetratricopeptide repeat protein [Micrococcales bacterium]|nr:tetratricopeptide repeat protein [Micrococcales bacterium]
MARDPEAIVSELYHTAMTIPEPYSSLSGKQKRLASKLVKRFDKAEAKHGPLPNGDILRPMLLSKNGQYTEALELAKAQYDQNPTWNTAGAVANAARRLGDLDYAVQMFTVAAEHDPDDDTCFLDIGDTYLEQDRWAEALTAYETVLAKDSAHQWALPSAFYCRHQLGVPGPWLDSLTEIANQEGCTCGLADCLSQVFGGYTTDQGIARAQQLVAR